MRLAICKTCGFEFYIPSAKKLDWQEAGQPCPSCGDTYSTKPKTEKKLFDLQRKFYPEKTNSKVLDQMTEILISYTASILLKHYYSFVEDEEHLRYYTTIAVSFFMDDYLGRKDFYVHVSFAGLLIHKIRQSLFNKYNLDSADESLDWQFEDGNEVEYSGFEDPFIDHIESVENRTQFLIYLYKLIISFSHDCSHKENYIRLLAISIYLEKGEKYADRIFQDEKIVESEVRTIIKKYRTYGKEGKYAYSKTLDLIKKELIKTLSVLDK